MKWGRAWEGIVGGGSAVKCPLNQQVEFDSQLVAICYCDGIVI